MSDALPMAAKKDKQAVLAVDFDGTIVEHRFPEIGPEVPNAIACLKEVQAAGGRILLWTMRHGSGLEAAVAFLKDRGIEPWGININPTQKSWTDSPKAYALLYIDDAAAGCPLIQRGKTRPFVNWAKIREHLQAAGVLPQTERAHHPYSPSTLQATECCPCYRSKQSDKPHVRTVAGTKAHGVVESGEDDQELGDDDAVAAAECLDFAESRRKLLQEAADRARVAQANACAHPALVQPAEFFRVRELKEVYLPVDNLVFPDCKATTAGYTDLVLVSHDGTYAEGFDWKFGFWPVEAPEANLQVISYSLGLFHLYPNLQAVRFWIKQPHLDVVKDAVFTREQVPALYLRVQTVVARARVARGLADFSMAVPAVPICNFCAELGRCTKVCEFACKIGRKFHPLGIPEEISPGMLQSPNQASLGLNLAAVLKIWAEAFRRQITDKILRREMELPEGQKIQTMSKRKLLDMMKLRAVALKYLTQSEYESTLEATFGSLETLIQNNAPRGSKKATVEAFQKELESAGAVGRSEEFSFLRAVAPKE